MGRVRRVGSAHKGMPQIEQAEGRLEKGEEGR